MVFSSERPIKCDKKMKYLLFPERQETSTYYANLRVGSIPRGLYAFSQT